MRGGGLAGRQGRTAGLRIRGWRWVRVPLGPTWGQDKQACGDDYDSEMRTDGSGWRWRDGDGDDDDDAGTDRLTAALRRDWLID